VIDLPGELRIDRSRISASITSTRFVRRYQISPERSSRLGLFFVAFVDIRPCRRLFSAATHDEGQQC
jgi:hypothetical protein